MALAIVPAIRGGRHGLAIVPAIRSGRHGLAIVLAIVPAIRSDSLQRRSPGHA
jgi:hypothetical protein